LINAKNKKMNTKAKDRRNDISAEEWEVRVDLAAMFRLTHMMGWDDTVWNHITARTPGTDHTFFMHRFGLLYEEVTASNLIKVDENGKVLEGPSDVNTAGFVIHSAVHLNHPKNKFVFHAHPPTALAATALKDGIPHLVQDSSMLYGKVGYHDWEGLSVDIDERHRIAKHLGDNKVLIMRNHGLLTCGESIAEAFMLMYYLDRACKTQIDAESTGEKLNIPSDNIMEYAAGQYDDPRFKLGKHEWPALIRLLDNNKSIYNQ